MQQSTSSAGAPKQSLRPERDDENHRQKQDDVGQLRKQRGAERVNEPDDEAADEGSEQASDASQDDDNQRQRQHVAIKSGISGQDRSAQHAPGAGDARAQTKHDRKQIRNGDSDWAR